MMRYTMLKLVPTFRQIVVNGGTRNKFIFHKLRSYQSKKSFSTEANSEEASVPVKNIRNFCIIAHVDHGKSTLADRLLEFTGAISNETVNKQVLDRLPVEKERGITVKAVTASIIYNYKNVNYLLNLIDTPGHVDFASEVSRSLYACQGVILLIDANEGVQAQTIANYNLASAMKCLIIPVLNKIDLPGASPDAVETELKNLFDIEKSSVLRISAKTGLGVENLLKAIIERVPPPEVDRNEIFKALLIDSWFDKYRGTILFIYIVSGKVRMGDEITSYRDKKSYSVRSTGVLTPEEKPVKLLEAGQVGVIGCNIKATNKAYVGDTLYASKTQTEPIPSFGAPKPMVFAGLYPRNQSEHTNLKSAIERLCLNDPSVSVSLETSPALGYGWRLGFLGLLHLDVFRQRLEQEYNTESVLTAPSVTYKIVPKKKKKKTDPDEIYIKNPVNFPLSRDVKECHEPVILATIITPTEYYSKILEECKKRRSKLDSSTHLDSNRLMLKFIIPLNEVLLDFHDSLKSLSSGYASFDYEDYGFQPANLKKMTILLNGKEVEELSMIVHQDKAMATAVKIATKLEELIPRQQVGIAVQAVVEGDILCRRNIKPYRKDVTAKLYGGDVTRRMKLLKNQKEGKKRMRMFANIEIERDTFINVLREK